VNARSCPLRRCGRRAGRAPYFLSDKDRADLEKETNADKIDAARDYLPSAVAAPK